jgi:hypothetical protein
MDSAAQGETCSTAAASISAKSYKITSYRTRKILKSLLKIWQFTIFTNYMCPKKIVSRLSVRVIPNSEPTPSSPSVFSTVIEEPPPLNRTTSPTAFGSAIYLAWKSESHGQD